MQLFRPRTYSASLNGPATELRFVCDAGVHAEWDLTGDSLGAGDRVLLSQKVLMTVAG